MLCQFAFENFRSYRDETIFDFQATPAPEFEDSLIQSDKSSKLLPVSVVYGPNGGGKSNLLEALGCLISTVVKPIYELESTHTPVILNHTIPCVPFLFDETSGAKPTSFQIFFRTKGYEYRYFLAILNGFITDETLARKKIGGKRAAHLFSRENTEVTLGSSLASKKLNTSVNAKMPYLSFLAINYNLPVITDVQQWFESCIVQNYANPKVEHRIVVSDDIEFKHMILNTLNHMGIDIQDYRLDEENQQFYVQRTIHNKKYELDFNEESDGTRKLLAALPAILLALQEGRLIVVDELDAKLHPKLLRYVISLFTNPQVNQHGAQLLFTSHDMSTMKNTIFRRDEIWFAAENENHSSEIYSLYEIRNEDDVRVKNTAAYDKRYLEGRYGADPYLQNILGGDWQ